PAELNAGFARAVTKWLEQTNTLIAKKTGKPSWLKLSYDSAQPGTLGTLWIEHFECLKFGIQAVSIFQRPEATERLTVDYAADGTSIQGVAEETVTVPPFDGTRIDKCHPQNPVKTLCAETPDLRLTVSKQVEGLKATLKVAPSGADRPVAYLWEIQD